MPFLHIDDSTEAASGVSLHFDLNSLQRADHSLLKLREVLDLQLLYLLTDGPSSGYDLNKKMIKEFGARVSYGTLYPKLASFERMGLLSSDWETIRSEHTTGIVNAKKKKVYKITEYGRGVLNQRLSVISKMFKSL
jgi:DNA-binding PadR family transcriptional regulator